MTAITLPARVSSKTRSASMRFVHYAGQSLLMTLKDWTFLAFTIMMPSVLYLLFSSIYGDMIARGGSDVKVSATMMITMAAYGGLTAALSAGSQIQAERSAGWFRQLVLTSITPAQFMTAKLIIAVVIVVPAISFVFGIGRLVRGVTLDAEVWLTSGALILLSLVPMIVLGMVIGLWFKPQSVQAVSTILVIVLGMVGGLLLPVSMMPGWMQAIARKLPTYWTAELGQWPLLKGGFPYAGLLVLGIWTLALSVLGFFGYRYSVRNSRR